MAYSKSRQRNLVLFLQKRGSIIVFDDNLFKLSRREYHAVTDSIPDETSLFRKISIFQVRAQDSGIRLDEAAEMQPEMPQEDPKAKEMSGNQSGELKADAETRDITEGQDTLAALPARWNESVNTS